MKENKTTKEKNIHAEHRSRMRKAFLENGFSSFSEIEQLEFLLFYAIPFKDTNPIAHRLLDEFKTIHGVVNATHEGLTRIKGVGENVATYLKSLLEFVNIYYKYNNTPKAQILGPKAAKNYCQNLFVGKQTEEFVIICLNNNSEVINQKVIGKGNVNHIDVETRDVSYFVMSNHCYRVVVAHNHPSGNPTPSDDDMSFTSKLFLNLGINDITLVDHIIVSPRGTLSMYESNRLEDVAKHCIKTHNFTPPVPNAKWKPYDINQ